MLVAVCDLNILFFLIEGCLVISIGVDGHWQSLVGCWSVDLKENLMKRIQVVSIDDVNDLNVSCWLAVDGCVDLGERWVRSLTMQWYRSFLCQS